MDLHLLVLDIQAKVVVNAHVLIRDPHQRKHREHVSAPVIVEQFEASEDQESGRDVMAEAIFTSEQIKKFTAGKSTRVFRLILAIVARLPEDLFMSYGPRHTCDGDR